MKKARVVAVDHGSRRVGLAMSDPLRMFPRIVGTYSPADALDKLGSLERDEGIERIVIGWPLEPDGSEGQATTRVEAFIKRIVKRIPGVPIVRLDERMSSVRARQSLIDTGVKKKDRENKTRIDSAAAAIILQDYLDSESQSSFANHE